MRILKWMRGILGDIYIKNKVICKKRKVASVEDKMREARLRWFQRVKRRFNDSPVRREVDCNRSLEM